MVWSEIPLNVSYSKLPEAPPHLTAAQLLLIHPLSMFRYYWDLLVFLLVLYTVYMLPYRLGFYWHAMTASHPSPQQAGIQTRGPRSRARSPTRMNFLHRRWPGAGSRP